MAFPTNNLFTSVFGHRLGLAKFTTAQSGASKEREYLMGRSVEDFKRTITAETTGTNLPPDGVSRVNGTSAASSVVYTLDPPIPGVMKVLSFESTSQGPIYVKTANGETFISTQGTTFSIIKSTGNTVGTLFLMGITTAIWGLANASVSSASFALSTTT